MYHPDINISPMDNLKRTGKHGKKKNTGINMGEKNGMVTKIGNINKIKVEAKGDTAIRS
jgi:hypothetical protein